MSIEGDFRTEVEAGILDWLDFDTASNRKVIARCAPGRRMHTLEAAALRAARRLQDEGRVSILTRRTPRMVTHIVERVS